MKHTYLDRALHTLKDNYEIDGLTELVLNRNDKIICYAQLQDPSDITLHVLAGDPSWIGLPNQESFPLQTLFEQMDLENSYAKVSGPIEYYNFITEDILNFEEPSNVTFPIINQSGRHWIRLTSLLANVEHQLYSFHFTIVTQFITAEEELFHKTHHDSLTGVFNKYTHDNHYGNRYQKEDFHVMFLDLDDFKDLNDVVGHQEGNVYLQKFADIMKRHEEGYTRFYRLGGDEFVGFIFHKEKKVKAIAQDIIKRTKELTKGTKGAHIGVSIGIVQATIRDDVVRKADRAMYQAKQQGKNQFVYIIET